MNDIVFNPYSKTTFLIRKVERHYLTWLLEDHPEAAICARCQFPIYDLMVVGVARQERVTICKCGTTRG